MPPTSKSLGRRAFGPAIGVVALLLVGLALSRPGHAQFGLPAVPGIPGAGIGGAAGALGGASAAAPQTLWRFLGFRGGDRLRKLRDALVNRRGNFPGLEKKPAIKSLTDPDNLKSDNPAVKKAAETKAAADAAPQKVKALKYLATVGCDKCNPGVKEALMAALDDCTEEVRFEGAKALRAVAGDKCNACRKTCCDQQLTDKLFDVAYGRDEACCYKESSARVRKMARQALCACATPGTGTIPPQPTEGPRGDPDEVKPEDATKGALTQAGATSPDAVQLAAEHQAKHGSASKQIISALFAPPGTGAREGREIIVPTPIRSISPRERQMAARAMAAPSGVVHAGGVQHAVVSEPVHAPVAAKPPVAPQPDAQPSAAPVSSVATAVVATQAVAHPPAAVPTAPAASPVQPAVGTDSLPAYAPVPAAPGYPAGSQVQQTAGPWTPAAERRFDAETSRHGLTPEDIDPSDPNRVPGGRLERLTRPLNNLIRQQQELPDEDFFMPGAPGAKKAPPREPARPAPAPTPARPAPQETVKKGPRAKPAPTPTPAQEPALSRKIRSKPVEPELEPEEEAPAPGEVSKWLAGKPKKPSDSKADEAAKLTGRLKLFGSGSVPADASANSLEVSDLADVLPKGRTPAIAKDGPELESPDPVAVRVPSIPAPQHFDPAEEAPLPAPMVAGNATPREQNPVDPEFTAAKPAKPAPEARPAPRPTVVPPVEGPESDLADAPLPGVLPPVKATQKPTTIEPTDRRFDVAAEVRAAQKSNLPFQTSDEPAPDFSSEPLVVAPRMPALIPRRRPLDIEAPLPAALPGVTSPATEPEFVAAPMPGSSQTAKVSAGKRPAIVLKPFATEETPEELLPAGQKAPVEQAPEFVNRNTAPAAPVAPLSEEPADVELEAPLPANLATTTAGVGHRGPATVAPRNVAREPAPEVAGGTPAPQVAPEVAATPNQQQPESPEPRVATRPRGPLVVLPGKSFRRELEEGEAPEAPEPTGVFPRPLPTVPIQLPGSADLSDREPEPIAPEPAATAKGPIQLPRAEPAQAEPAPIQLPGTQEAATPATGIRKGPKLFPGQTPKSAPMRLPGAESPEAAEPAAPIFLPGAMPTRREPPPPADAPSPTPIQLPGQSSSRKPKAKNGQAAAELRPIKLGGMTIFLRDEGATPETAPSVEPRVLDHEIAMAAAPLRLPLHPPAVVSPIEPARERSSIRLLAAREEAPAILQQSYVVPAEESAATPALLRGRVQTVDAPAGVIELSFTGERPPVGARLSLVRTYPSENVYLGDIEVIESGARVLARPTHWLPVQRITAGDQVCREGDPLLSPVE